MLRVNLWNEYSALFYEYLLQHPVGLTYEVDVEKK